MALQIIQCDVSKNEVVGARKEKLIHQAGHVNNKGISLLETNCILWT